MKHIRWYDKNPDLKDVFEFIKGLERSVQKEIAKDIIQILMNDFGLNLDERINKISQDYDYECKRWYDNNVDLFSSFEIIKNLSKSTQDEVVRKIIESVLLIYIQEGNANG